jgi:hypothetical protein
MKEPGFCIKCGIDAPLMGLTGMDGMDTFEYFWSRITCCTDEEFQLRGSGCNSPSGSFQWSRKPAEQW